MFQLKIIGRKLGVELGDEVQIVSCLGLVYSGNKWRE